MVLFLFIELVLGKYFQSRNSVFQVWDIFSTYLFDNFHHSNFCSLLLKFLLFSIESLRLIFFFLPFNFWEVLSTLFSKTSNECTISAILIALFFFETEFCSCCPGWSAMVWAWLTVTSTYWVQAISPASASWVAGITGARHHAQLIFLYF